MIKNIIFVIVGFLLGIALFLFVLIYTPILNPGKPVSFLPNLRVVGQKQVIGFLPYWLLYRANPDYSKYITTLTYFALRIDKDGSILKLINPKEEEPGWYTLNSGKANQFFKKAKEKNLNLSLTLDSGDSKTITSFIATPSANAKRLVTDSLPVLKKYGFSDLNLDIEYTSTSSATQRKEFVSFIRNVRKNLPEKYSLTLEISTLDVIMNQLIDVKSIAPIADNVILMAYDFHASNSFVIGPVAPLNGAGIDSEYDVATAVEKTLQFMPSQKLILGIPLYGYEWEALGTTPRLAAIPGSGVADSNRRAEDFLESCATCSAKLDINADEPYFEFFSNDSNTNHIIFYPDQSTTKSKIDFANKNALGGIALWALGYEGKTILNPLYDYKNKIQ